MTKIPSEDWSRVRFDKSDVEILEEVNQYQGFFQIKSLTLRHRLYRGGWSTVMSRELFRRHDAVGVLLYDPKIDCVALVEQFRVGVFGSARVQQNKQSPWVWELVAGIIDKDEPVENIAMREAQEEASVLIEALEPIADYYCSPGGSNEYFYLFAGKADLSQAGGVHGLVEEGEDIRVHVLKVEDCWQKLLRGELNNAHTLIALQWLKIHRERIKALWGIPLAQ